MRVAIVGGYGRFGRWMAKRLRNDGFEIVLCGRSLEKAISAAKALGVGFASINEAVSTSDVVIVSVPIPATYEVCRLVANKMRRRALLVEVSSVKSGIADRLQKELKEVEFVSIHPLFGPRAEGLSGQNVVLIEGCSEKGSRCVEEYLIKHGAKVVYMSVEDHDRAMALLQAIHHLSLLGYALLLNQAYNEYGLDVEKLITRSLGETLAVIESIVENRNSVCWIYEHNPFVEEFFKAYLKAVEDIAKRGIGWALDEVGELLKRIG